MVSTELWRLECPFFRKILSESNKRALHRHSIHTRTSTRHRMNDGYSPIVPSRNIGIVTKRKIITRSAISNIYINQCCAFHGRSSEGLFWTSRKLINDLFALSTGDESQTIRPKSQIKISVFLWLESFPGKRETNGPQTNFPTEFSVIRLNPMISHICLLFSTSVSDTFSCLHWFQFDIISSLNIPLKSFHYSVFSRDMSPIISFRTHWMPRRCNLTRNNVMNWSYDGTCFRLMWHNRRKFD
jgi:hypothetical protein